MSPMKILLSLLLIFVLSTITTTTCNGQKGIEAGAWLGVGNYFGDLNNRVDLTRPGLALGVIVKRNFNERLSLRGGLNYARLSANDADSPNNFERNRNLSFRTDIFDLTGAMEFNFFPHVHGSLDHSNTPYMLGGISIVGFVPTAVLDGERHRLRPLGTEGQNQTRTYGAITGGFVLGGGWKFDVGETTTVAIELTYHRLFTDYLDDVSTVYPSQGSLTSELARQFSDRSLDPDQNFTGKQRGDSTTNDSYTFFGVSLVKYWGKLECPRISSW